MTRASSPELGRLLGVGEGAGEAEGVEFLLNEKRFMSCWRRPPTRGALRSEEDEEEEEELRSQNL